MDRKQVFSRLVEMGWTADLLPIIPPRVKLAKGTSIPESALGKVPGRPYADGTWGGIARWETLRATQIEIDRWLKTPCSVGMICRRVRYIDLDIDNPELAAASRHLIEKRLGPTMWRGRPGTPRGALGYRAEPAIGSKQKISWDGGKIEILGYGNQLVIWGEHPSGGHYEWQNGSPFDRRVEDLPLLAEADIPLLFDAIAALLHDYGIAAGKPTVQGGTIRRVGVRRPLGHPDLVAQDKAQAVRALWTIPNTPLLPDGSANTWAADYDHVIAIIAAFMGAVGGDQELIATELVRWLHEWPKNTDEWINEKINSFRRDGTEIGAEALFHCAKLWNFHEVPVGTFKPIQIPELSGDVVSLGKVREEVTEIVQGPEKPILPASTNVGNAYTDQQLAIDCWHNMLSFMLRYDASGHWMHWNGQRWVRDTTNGDNAAHLVRNIIGGITQKLPEGKQGFNLAFRLEDARRATAVLQILRKFALVSKWDTNPYLLNTPRGIVNLRTGQWRAATSSDLVRSVTAVAPEDEPPTVWLKAATEIFDDNLVIRQIWIDWMAINLPGIRLRDVAVILRGSGRNGKSLLLQSIVSMLGDIHEGGYGFITASPDAFDLRTRGRSDTGSLGYMDGARSVVFPEIANDFKPNEALLKSAITGEKVEAKFLYCPVFSFPFTAGLSFSSNIDIEFTSSIPALRNRFHIFDLVRFFNDDREFFNAVLADAPRLLGLCIRRCTEILQGAETFWLPKSWSKHKTVYGAIGMRSQEYFDLQDPVASILRRLIERSKGAALNSRDVITRLQMGLKTVLDRCDGEAPKIEEALAMGDRSLSMHIARAMAQEFGVRPVKSGADRLKRYRGVTWQEHPILPFADRDEEE